MPSQRQIQPRLNAALLAFCAIPSVLVFAAFPWLKQQSLDLILAVTGIAGILTVLASLAQTFYHDRSMDEWEKSNSRFSGHWGNAAGTSLVMLLLILPVGRQWILSVVAAWTNVSNPDSKLVFLAFGLGFGAVVIARVVCMALVSIGWVLWKSRPAHDAL